ncbi:MAG: hypothetical protein ACLFRX_09425 [Gemmatimonadota bacterium]
MTGRLPVVLPRLWVTGGSGRAAPALVAGRGSIGATLPGAPPEEG